MAKPKYVTLDGLKCAKNDDMSINRARAHCYTARRLFTCPFRRVDSHCFDKWTVPSPETSTGEICHYVTHRVRGERIDRPFRHSTAPIPVKFTQLHDPRTKKKKRYVCESSSEERDSRAIQPIPPRAAGSFFCSESYARAALVHRRECLHDIMTLRGMTGIVRRSIIIARRPSCRDK